MPFDLLGAMNLCGRRDQSDHSDPIPLQQGQATTNATKDAASHNADLEAGQGIQGAQGAQGMSLVDLAMRADRDIYHTLTRRHTGPAALCLLEDSRRIVKLWREYCRLDQEDKDQLAVLYPALREAMHKYYEFFVLTHQVNGFAKPDKMLLKTLFRAGIDDELFDDEKSDDWVSAYDIDPIKQAIDLLPHRELFERFLPRPEGTTIYKGFELRPYAKDNFQIVTWALFRLVVAALAVVPVTVQASGVTSKTGNVVIFAVSVLLLIIFSQSFDLNHSSQTLLILTYTAVVGNNIIGG